MNFGLVEYWMAQEVASWIDRDKPDREESAPQPDHTQTVTCDSTQSSNPAEARPGQALNPAG